MLPPTKFPIKGEVRIYETNPKDIDSNKDFKEEVRKHRQLAYENKNVIVTVGKRAIFDYLIGAQANGEFFQIAVGTGTATATEADRDLQSVLGGWADYSDRYRVVDDLFINRIYLQGDAVGLWTEAGQRNKAQILISRANVNYNKNNSTVITVEWRYYFA